MRQRLLPEQVALAELQRWLRAEKYDVDKAFKRLRHHLQWRRDYLPRGCVLEVCSSVPQNCVLVWLMLGFAAGVATSAALWVWQEEVRAELEQKKVLLQGCDSQGRPVTVVIVNKHIPRCPAETKRYVALRPTADTEKCISQQ